MGKMGKEWLGKAGLLMSRRFDQENPRIA